MYMYRNKTNPVIAEELEVLPIMLTEDFDWAWCFHQTKILDVTPRAH